jgi:hypothetical protein
VLDLAQRLGIIINLAKSNLVLSCRFLHLGIDFDLVQGLVFPSPDALKKINFWAKYLHQYKKVMARAYLSLLGLLSHESDMIPLGRLHLRPLQFYLKCFWRANRDSLNAPILLDEMFFKALAWWENSQNLTPGDPLHLRD